MRTCKICNLSLPVNSFYGGRKTCKKCYTAINKEYVKQWKEDNKQRVKEVNHKWFKNNIERKQVNTVLWRKVNIKKVREKQNQYCNEKYINDLSFKLSVVLRSRLNKAIKNNQKAGSAVRDLGCSINELKLKLATSFYLNPETGEMMTWDNYGEWHVDHITPISSFDLTDPEQVRIACHYTNLQPLWAKDNIKKGDK